MFALIFLYLSIKIILVLDERNPTTAASLLCHHCIYLQKKFQLDIQFNCLHRITREEVLKEGFSVFFNINQWEPGIGPGIFGNGWSVYRSIISIIDWQSGVDNMFYCQNQASLLINRVLLTEKDAANSWTLILINIEVPTKCMTKLSLWRNEILSKTA